MEVIGKYRLVRKLAEGGMAEVFLAQVEGPGGFLKPVVVKRMLPELSGDESFISMFLSEAKLVAQFNHPNIVQVFDFGQHQGNYFLVMEYVDGFNLRSLYKKAFGAGQPIPFELAARMVVGACEGLAYAHSFAENGRPLNLIHRDVSPENLLVGSNGVVKVADFGIARVAGQKRMTRTGTVRGKIVYMAPEQMQGEPVDCRVDVFALGLVLYELICGRRPFEAKTEVDAIRAILSGTMTPASTWRPDMPAPLQAIIDKAMARSSSDRYRDCTELQLALDRFLAVRGVLANAQSIARFVEKFADPVTQQPVVSIRKPEPLEQSVTSPSLPPLQGATRIVPPPAAFPVATMIIPPREQITLESRPRSGEPSGSDSRSGSRKGAAKKKRSNLPMIALGSGTAIIFSGALFLGLSHRTKAEKPATVAVVVKAPAKIVAAPAAEPAPLPAFQEEDYPIAPPPPPPPPASPGRATRPSKPRVDSKPANAAKLTGPGEEPPTAAARVVKGRILPDPSGKGVIINNDTAFNWTACEVRLPMRKRFRFGKDEAIEANGTLSLSIGKLEDDFRPPDQNMQDGWALLRCVEGTGYVWWGAAKLQ